MRQVKLLDAPAQVAALSQPLRLAILRHLLQPASCAELAAALGAAPQKVNYHVRALEEAGLVDRVGERRKRALREGVYRAAARSLWLSPDLVGRPGSRRRVGGQVRLGFLVHLTELLQHDVAALARHSDDVPAAALVLDVDLADPARRQAFLADVGAAFESLGRKYGSHRAGAGYKLALACYPDPGGAPESG